MNLKKGNKGPEVVQLQYLLSNRGYSNIKVDGDFGMITETAVKDFQSKHGMVVNGIVDAAMLASLNGPVETIVKGIDVSHYQASPDWKKVKADGITFAYIKVTEGVTGKDAKTNLHGIGANAVGIKVGYYHFASLNDSVNVAADAAAEAKFFNDTLKTLPVAGNLPPVLDIETNKSNLSPMAVQLWITTFLNTMVSLGHPVTILYSYTPFLDQYLPQNHPFGNVPLWIAQYRDVEYPKMPHGWTSYTIWQYTNTGNVNGIGPCDNNKAPASFIA